MNTILVLMPISPTMTPILEGIARAMLRTLTNCEIHARVCDVVGDGRPFSAHAAARNAMLDWHLRPEHTHVLWIDADVVDYPADLPQHLLAADPAAIVAPLPLIEESTRFYDVYGFRDSAGGAPHTDPPYLAGGPLVPMQAVGTCYLAPASLYHAGVRYAPTAGQTEHWSVCQAAIAAGMPVYALQSLTIAHANLPRYGVAWHTVGGAAA